MPTLQKQTLTGRKGKKKNPRTQGWSQDLELGGVILLLATCSSFGFWLYCVADKSFLLLLLLLLCVCRACLLLVRKKLFCLKFFKGLSCLFLVKLVEQSLFFFSFILAFLSPIGNFCCWANILGLYFFFKDFRSNKFFLWPLKRRKILDLQIFLQIVIYKLLL